jgi:hypothetical protein
VREQIRAVEQERLRKLAAAPAAEKGSHAMVRLIAQVLGVAHRYDREQVASMRQVNVEGVIHATRAVTGGHAGAALRPNRHARPEGS